MNDGAPTDLILISGQRRALIGMALSQLLVPTLWFSAAGVAPQPREQWGLSVGQSSWITLAVQMGFVVGAFAIALSGLADSVAARKLFTLAEAFGWQWAFPWLEMGPIVGILAMIRLRKSPESRMLAGGIR